MRTSSRTWLGRILVAQGAIGLLLLVPGLIMLGSMVSSGFGAGDTASEVDAALSRASASVTDGSRVARAAEAALGSAGYSATQAGAMMSELGTTMRQGSEQLRIEIFGSRPFLSLADSFARTADRADAAAGAIGSTAPQIDQGRQALHDLAADLDALVLEVAALRSSIVAGPPSIALDALAMGVAAWLAMSAAISLGIGRRLLQQVPEDASLGFPGRQGRATTEG
jgi:hypothetical protein